MLDHARYEAMAYYGCNGTVLLFRPNQDSSDPDHRALDDFSAEGGWTWVA